MKDLVVTTSKGNKVINAIAFNDVDSSYQIGLTLGVEETIPIPKGATLVRFVVASGATVWVSTVANINIPTGGVIISGTNNAEPNPAQRKLSSQNTNLYFLSETDAKIGIYFYNA